MLVFTQFFRVSQLKMIIPLNANTSSQLLMPHMAPPVSVAISDRKIVKRGNQAATKVLI